MVRLKTNYWMQAANRLDFTWTISSTELIVDAKPGHQAPQNMKLCRIHDRLNCVVLDMYTHFIIFLEEELSSLDFQSRSENNCIWKC
jgi:hypothetical protein